MNKYALLLILTLCSYKNFAADFSLESSAFPVNGMIPSVFTCDGSDKSPPFTWKNIPAKTQSLALVAEDPNAPSGSWTHWIVFNIPPTVNHLNTDELPDGASLAKNSWGNTKYQGPCPSIGAHRYVFTLYALDKVLSLEEGSETQVTMDSMTGHVLGSAVSAGLYQK